MAKQLLRIAKNLVAYDESKIKSQFEKIRVAKEKWINLSSQNDRNIDELQRQIDQLQSIKAQIEKKRKQQYSIFDKQVGVSVTLKSITDALAQAMRLGQNIDGLVQQLSRMDEDFVINAHQSQKPAYKAAWEILVSTLTGTEYEKLVKLLQVSFSKNLVQISSCVDLMKKSSKSFNIDIEKQYEERVEQWNKRNPNNPLPKKLKASIKTAGVKDILFDIGSWITKTYKEVINKFQKVLSNILGWNSKAQKTNQKLKDLVNMVKNLK